MRRLLILVVFLAGCGESTATQQSTNSPPTITTAPAAAISTMRPSTATPVPTRTPRPTSTIGPTKTPRPTSTIGPTRTPKPPTATPDPLTFDDSEYRDHLAEKFQMVGSHRLDLEKVTVDSFRVSGENFHMISFKISSKDSIYFHEEDTAADRHAWAVAVLEELKTHWPGEDVTASLFYSYTSTNLSVSDSDCFSTGTSYIPGSGWIHLRYHARLSWSLKLGESISCTD